MLTTALEGFGGVAAMLAPVLVFLATRMRVRRAELVELQDRVDIRDATIAALWDYVLELRYWMVKGQVGEPPTMPSTLTVAAVRARISA
jgi:arginase family enzyme